MSERRMIVCAVSASPGRRPGRTVWLTGACLLMAGLAAPAREPRVIVHVEQGGILSIEAEAFGTRANSTYARYAQEHAWHRREDPAAGGGRYLVVLPDERGEDGRGPPSPRDASGAALTYRIRVTQAGVYHVYVRGLSQGGESNGIHVGLDGELAARGPGASNLSGFRPEKRWQWEHRRKEGYAQPATLTLPAGDHRLCVWSRDDGFKFDKLLLTLAAERPTGLGPAPSPTVEGPAPRSP